MQISRKPQTSQVPENVYTQKTKQTKKRKKDTQIRERKSFFLHPVNQYKIREANAGPPTKARTVSLHNAAQCHAAAPTGFHVHRHAPPVHLRPRGRGRGALGSGGNYRGCCRVSAPSHARGCAPLLPQLTGGRRGLQMTSGHHGNCGHGQHSLRNTASIMGVQKSSLNFERGNVTSNEEECVRACKDLCSSVCGCGFRCVGGGGRGGGEGGDSNKRQDEFSAITQQNLLLLLVLQRLRTNQHFKMK